MTIRVLVVDDAIVIRRILVDIINSDPDLEVVGTASNGRLALARVEQLEPDIVTLDIEMPEMDGIEALKEIRKMRPRLPVVMFSTLTTRGAVATLDALAAGASDYIAKPANVGKATEAIAQVSGQVIPRLKALVPRASSRDAATPGSAAPPLLLRTEPVRQRAISSVLVGSSTGGPVALEKMLSAIPTPLGVPMFIVQHMPPVFTGLLAERLDQKVATTVTEAVDGEVAHAGHAYLAPGGMHMRLVRDGARVRMRLDEGPQVNFCRPSVDVLFESAAALMGGHQLAVMLTGMGQDGLDATTRLAGLGAQVVAQDEATSVVWGMPGAVARAGIANSVLPLDRIGPEIVRRIDASSAAAAARTKEMV